MSRASFRQADLQRIMRGAKNVGSTVQMDMRTLVVTVLPVAPPFLPIDGSQLIPDGKENWDGYADVGYDPRHPARSPIQPLLDGKELRAMERMVSEGIGVTVSLSTLRNVGPGTGQKLIDRGYAKAVGQLVPMEKLSDITLTEKGLSDWRAQEKLSKGNGRYPIPTTANDPVRTWYERIGFDPRTMGPDDMKRLRVEAHAKWKASIPGTKIGRRELAALIKLAEIGLHVRVWSYDVKGCGDDTMDRLEARGFIGREQTLPPEKVAEGYSKDEIWLLQAGLNAASSAKS